MLIVTNMNESIDTFFNPKEWPSEDNTGAIVLIYGYIFMFSFSILYWIYKFLQQKRP